MLTLRRQAAAMELHEEFESSVRYLVLTRLGDSWILRAAHEELEGAEAEAFRWRRIYGPNHTLVATRNRPSRRPPLLPAVIDVVAEVVEPEKRHSPANDAEAPPFSGAKATRRRRQQARAGHAEPPGADRRREKTPHALGLGETFLRALTLYLGYQLANRLLDLAFALHNVPLQG